MENYCVAWEFGDTSFNRSGHISLRREEGGGREGRILELLVVFFFFFNAAPTTIYLGIVSSFPRVS